MSPPVAPFDPELLPDAIRPAIIDIAERMQCPPEFPAVAAMVCLSSLVGRALAIRPKRHDDWTVSPNLWGALIGRSGVMKSQAKAEIVRLMEVLEREAASDHDTDMNEWEAEQLLAKLEAKAAEDALKREVKSAARKPEDRIDALKKAAEIVKTEIAEPPKARRFIVNDTTVEKLGEIMRDSPRGILYVRDELTGFLRAMDRSGHEQDRAFHLEAWNGGSGFTFDRIGRGTIRIEAACEAILGGIQPGPFRAYLRSAIQAGEGDDGLVQRFQLAVYPDHDRAWRNVDRRPDPEARASLKNVFRELARDGLGELGHTNESADQSPYLRFTDEAQAAFDDYRSKLEHLVRSGDLHPAVESHLAKYRSLVPSLALIIHLADGSKGDVVLESLARALGWAELLESHALRIYDSIIRQDAVCARALAQKIRSGTLSDGFTARDVYRRQWADLTTKEDVQVALDLLVDLAWLNANRIETGGRAKVEYRINPRLEEVPS